MDDRRDAEEYKIEKKFGRLPAEPTEFEIILDNHYPECPTAVSARNQIKSTLCYCKQIEDADNAAKAEIAAEECLRCHNLAADCKCGSKSQLV